ncbi:MAG: molybdopterin-binding protein [Deltaproteobacteria bacterium]|nr:molybdopterin-binding protein [Deltaproteobacteria bacterium]
MCEACNPDDLTTAATRKTIPTVQAVGKVLAHDITEIRPGEFKGRAFRKGHVVRESDVEHLQRLGKENLFVIDLSDDEMHEDDAALALATALAGSGVVLSGAPEEGKINLVAGIDGLIRVNKDALRAFNMLGEVACATLHDATVVKKGQIVAGTRAIPLVVKRKLVKEAVRAAAGGVVSVAPMRRPRVGVVITGNEVFHGQIKDAFAPVIREKVAGLNGEIAGLHYAPDDAAEITHRLREQLDAGADLLIATGGMSVDPDDVTRHAIRAAGARDVTYGSPVLPGSMFLVGYIPAGNNGTSREVPILGIPACGMYAKTTIFDLVLPRILAGERIGRSQLADLGHGGLCLKCPECRYPVCPFGK